MSGVWIVLPLAATAGAGAVIRWWVSDRLNHEFPTGTLMINLVASLALGVVSAAPDPLPVVLGVGLLGALSTWSTAAVEVTTMARRGDGSLAAGYLALSVTSGIVAAWLGLQLGPVVL